ncbi:MAG TPA: alginate export family protein [Chthonomonadaceae bacterium]|nr:alginate export family protein [Chthonomonadaceae bacterium]
MSLSARALALRLLALSTAFSVFTASQSEAQTPAAPPPAPQPGWHLFGSWRVRPELWNFFPTSKADGSYLFTGSMLRIGVQRHTSREETLLELEQPTLIDLPTQAVATAPQGQLGQGASYFAANGGQVASLFIKQGYVRFKNVGNRANSLRLGRFEFSDGMEGTAADPSLAYLKRERIGQRLLGPFLFTHIGRSFDGLTFAVDRPGHNITAALALPTRGVFSLRGMDTLSDVKIAYLSATTTRSGKWGAQEGRLFGLYYDDVRSGVVKTDNRPLAVRAADKKGLHIATVGGHYAWIVPMGASKADALLWGAGQIGDWGSQRQGGFAFAAEAGYQPANVSLRPWFRLGYYYASGDGSPGNSQHGTFFPALPTPRIYARFPFYTQTNLQDAFAQALLRPDARLNLRLDFHKLALADGHDLWYAGGGAFENATFGYSGRPTGGSRDLGTLVDLSVDYQLQKTTTLTFYFAYANAGNAVRNTFAGRDADMTPIF